jgi:hypothetical protein
MKDQAHAPWPPSATKPTADGLTLITADREDFGRELALIRAVEPSVFFCGSFPMSSEQPTSPPYSSPT